MPIINGQNYNQRQLLNSALTIGRLTLTKHYNHWLANGVPDPSWNSDWAAKGHNPPPALNPSQHFFGPDGKWHDGYTYDAVPENPEDRPADIGTNPAPTYPAWWEEDKIQYPPIKIDTIMGWEYLQDLAELWSGINLATNSTFPQMTSWPINPTDFESKGIGVNFTDFNIKNPIAPLVKFDGKVGNELRLENNNTVSRNRVDFGPMIGVVGNSWVNLDYHCRCTVGFGYSETTWTTDIVNHWAKVATFPFCHTTVNPSHWFPQKYNENNTYVIFASLPDNFDSFVIQEQGISLNPPTQECIVDDCWQVPDAGTSTYSVFSIPDFLQYEVANTKRLYKDAQRIPKEIKTSSKIQFNSIILYADNNGTPVLISASKIDPPIISKGKGKSIFYTKYYFAGQAVTNINIVEI